jgi:phosphate transport system substrate-binding protein
MKKTFLQFVVSMLLLALACTQSMAINKQVVGGAGPSTKVVKLFFSQFCLQPCAVDYEFVVPPMSTKHRGGIMNSDKFLFGRTGRPLNDEELSLRKNQVFLAKVPIAFATGKGSHISSLSMDQIKKIYLGEISNWNELGGPDIEIVTVGREQTEALFTELKGAHSFFEQAKFDIVFKKDDAVVEFLKTPVGKYAVAFGAKPNFKDVNKIVISDEFNAGVRLGLVYDQANANDPIVKAVEDYAASSEWKDLVSQANLIPLQ